jgi:hypothetical protein
MSLHAKLLRLALAALLAAGSAGCRSGAHELTRDAPSDRPIPTSSAQAEALKKTGVAWDDGEVRAYYLRTVASIGPSNEGWKRGGVAAEERARRAFQVRHDARVTARAMMKDPSEVRLLELRDQQKYGHPDGPTFDELVAHQKEKGLTGDAVYEAIVESAQRTEGIVNELSGARGK